MPRNGGFATIQKLVIDRGELWEKSGSLLFHFRQGPVSNGSVFYIEPGLLHGVRRPRHT